LPRSPPIPKRTTTSAHSIFERIRFADARIYLEQTVKLRPEYPEAWNNLAMVAAQDGRQDEAIRDFKRSLSVRPDYVTALLNLGNLYRRQGIQMTPSNSSAARSNSNLKIPNPTIVLACSSLGKRIFQAQGNFWKKPFACARTIPKRWNNLGILLTRQNRNFGS